MYTHVQAIIATVFGRYFEAVYTGISFQPSDLTTEGNGYNTKETYISKFAAGGLIIFLTLLNCSGVRESSTVSKLLTILKLLLVVVLFLVAMIYTTKNPIVIQNNLSYGNSFKNSNNVTSFFSAMIACLWSFDGWAGTHMLNVYPHYTDGCLFLSIIFFDNQWNVFPFMLLCL